MIEFTRTEDLLSALARRKLDLPGDWAIARMEWVGNDMLVEGGPVRLITRGPRKGRAKWDRMTHKVILREEEIAAEKARHEAATGQCWPCHGSGQEFQSWNKETGVKTRTCRKCGGSGKPK